MQPVMLVVGTRPEGIKMMPVYRALKKASIPTLLCSTGQHGTLLQEVFDLFGVVPDIRLSIMQPGQSLSYITQAVLSAMEKVYLQYSPSLVLVQGDTTTVMAASLAAFYQKIPVGHVEAGLRTGDFYNPYPEEYNRVAVGTIAQYHFAPTAYATSVLLREGKPRESVFCVGNTVVDALHYIGKQIADHTIALSEALKKRIQDIEEAGKKIIVVTMHRRESFDGGIERVLTALASYARQHEDCVFIYPRHPNPAVTQAIIKSEIATVDRCVVIDAVPYHELVYLLQKADLIITDSGGIQEEGVSLSKSVIVVREKSERMEGVWEGYAHLVGTDEQKITRAIDRSLVEKKKEETSTTVYGDGHAGERIVRIIQSILSKEPTMQLHAVNNGAMEKRMRA